MISEESSLDDVQFDANGLVPAIVQHARDHRVRMLGYMNRQALEESIETGFLHFWSRSRQKLWKKGETSGNLHYIERIHFDCDGDTLLIEVDPVGPTCHEGTDSCFDRAPLVDHAAEASQLDARVMEDVAAVIAERKRHPVEGSYTSYLFREGVDKIGKKIGEESAEVIIASKNGNKAELASESADLLYHLLVMLEETGTDLNDVWSVLSERRGRPKTD